MGAKNNSRREFLKTLGWLFASGASSGLLSKAEASTGSQKSASYILPAWTGDNFTRGHELRNGALPEFPKLAESSVDFVIIGGGMAGLTSAYYLQDANYILLEQYEELGGQSRGQNFQGIDYSLGAAYMNSNEGIYGQLFDDLGIAPTELSPIKNAWLWEKKWYPGYEGNSKPDIYRQLQRLIKEATPVWKVIGNSQPQLPLNQDLAKLDSTTFASYLQSFDSAFMSLMDSFCKSACCGSANELSALAGFYLLEDLTSPSYVFKGGNSAVVKALEQKINDSALERTIKGAFVWQVDLKDGGASVVYSDSTGEMHRIDCKKVILTAPPLVAWRIVPGLSDQVKAGLMTFKFGSYLVANFCMKKRIFNGAYDNWVGAPFSFTDVITAETPYINTGTYKPEMGSVLTVYQPYSPISPGRPLLLAGNREEFANCLIKQLSGMVEQFEHNLAKVVLTRWGHAMAVARPHMFAQITKLQAADTGAIILAHNSMQGLPSAESAIGAARLAANKALGRS